METFDFRGEVVDFEVKVKWEGFQDWDYLTLRYSDGREVTLRGGDHGNEDPWVYVA